MEFRELVIDRRTVRNFTSEPIAQKDIKEIIATATNSCNSGNKQLWHFIVIQNDEIKHRMAEIAEEKAEQIIREVSKAKNGVQPTYTPQKFYLAAPVVIAVITKGVYHTKPDLLMLEAGYNETMINDLRCRGDLQTAGAVTQLILLAAWEKGLGGCWMTGPLYARRELEKLLGISEGHSLAALIPIGKPATMPARSLRKPIEEVITFLE